MRLVAKFDKEDQAKRYSLLLQKEEIKNFIESEIDEKTKKRTLLIWVEEEDLTDRAAELYNEFIKDPENKKYDIPVSVAYTRPLIEDIPIKIVEKKRKNPISLTMIVIGICSFIYFINFFQEAYIAKRDGQRIAVVTPIQLALFYDVPKALLKLNDVLKKYPISSFRSQEDIPPELVDELKAVNELPQWRGIYPWVLEKIQKKKEVPVEGMFLKIRHGQIWRLFSPCILHTRIIHLLFNMLWVAVLLKQIETKVKKWKTVLFILVVGIFSNTCQYLMSGPLFLGFSGIVVGFAGYIWSRQKNAPWEGYTINKSTFIFLAVYVFGMMGLQLLSFVFQSFGSSFFQYNIANTAHISGGIAGWLLGKFSFFSMEVN